MFSQPLDWAQWAGPVTGVAATMLVIFSGYVVAGSKRTSKTSPTAPRRAAPTVRKPWRSSVPHTGRLPSDLEYQVEFTWK
jgi:hypothetical protein